jgi:hypothetical protein
METEAVQISTREGGRESKFYSSRVVPFPATEMLLMGGPPARRILLHHEMAHATHLPGCIRDHDCRNSSLLNLGSDQFWNEDDHGARRYRASRHVPGIGPYGG